MTTVDRWTAASRRMAALAREWATTRTASEAFDRADYAALHARLSVRYARIAGLLRAA